MEEFLFASCDRFAPPPLAWFGRISTLVATEAFKLVLQRIENFIRTRQKKRTNAPPPSSVKRSCSNWVSRFTCCCCCCYCCFPTLPLRLGESISDTHLQQQPPACYLTFATRFFFSAFTSAVFSVLRLCDLCLSLAPFLCCFPLASAALFLRGSEVALNFSLVFRSRCFLERESGEIPCT